MTFTFIPFVSAFLTASICLALQLHAVAATMIVVLAGELTSPGTSIRVSSFGSDLTMFAIRFACSRLRAIESVKMRTE